MTIDPDDLASMRLFLCYVATQAVDRLIDNVRISGELPTGRYVLEMDLTQEDLDQVLEQARHMRAHDANRFMVSIEDIERMFRQQNASDQ